jgi:hypothetical protein
MTHTRNHATESILPPEEVTRDYALWGLVDAANSADLVVGVTLIVGGAVITGKTISAHRYWSTVADELAAPEKASKGALALAEVFRSIDAATSSSPSILPSTPSSIVKEVPAIAQFIHLIDAELIRENAGSRRLGIFRVRLSEVDGWSFNEGG